MGFTSFLQPLIKFWNPRKLITGCSSFEQSPEAELIFSSVDLLTEILSRLPARSLIRLKCVSKHWLALISDPEFAMIHARKNRGSLISGLYFNPCLRKEKVASLPIYGLSSLPTLAFLDVVGAESMILHVCNGLILLIHRDGTPYIVCNLTTQKYALVPEPGDASLGLFGYKFDACLAFDPSKSPHYKIVLVCYSSYDGRYYQIDIYSSKNASWKRILVAAPPGIPFRCRAFWNGAIQWMSNENVHIRFEVDAEKLTGTPMPLPPAILEESILYFGECGDRLLLIQICMASGKWFGIREMDRDYCGWIVKHLVDLGPIISVFPEIVHSEFSNFPLFSVLCVAKGPNEEDLALVIAIPGKVISYNLKCNTSKVLHGFPLGKFPEPRTGYYFGSAYQFIESLSPVLSIS